MRKKFKMRLPVWGKMIIVFGIVSVMFSAAFLLKDTTIISKYKYFLWKKVNNIFYDSDRHGGDHGKIVESDNIKDIQKKVPIYIQTPKWLPEGFELDYAEYIEDIPDEYNITLKYVKDEDKYFGIRISTLTKVDKHGYMVPFEELDVNGYEVLLVESEINCSADYMNRQNFHVGISGGISKEELIKIIESME